MGFVKPLILDDATKEEREFDPLTDLLVGATEKDTTALQPIISAGPAVIAHNLSGIPCAIFVFLKNKTAEFGYVPNDIVLIHAGPQRNNNSGVMIRPDATDLNIKFGSSATVFNVVDATTGQAKGITNTFWDVFFVSFF